jgi:hypothetical protein
MSSNAFKLRDADDFDQGYNLGYYVGYTSAVYPNLFTRIAYGEGQEICRYLSQF